MSPAVLYLWKDSEDADERECHLKVRTMIKNERYQESQKFTQLWFWGILAFSALTIFYRFWEEHSPAQFHNLAIRSVAPVILFALVLVFLLLLRLDVLIDENGISYKWFPFRMKYKTIPWEKIESLQIRRFSPIAEFGGYGLRYTFKTTAYIVSGNDGIEIRIKGSKRKFVLGISDPVRVEEIIKKQRAAPMLTH